MPNALVMTGKFRTHIQDTCLIANTFLQLCAKKSASVAWHLIISKQREANGDFCLRNQQHFTGVCVEGEEVMWRIV